MSLFSFKTNRKKFKSKTTKPQFNQWPLLLMQYVVWYQVWHFFFITRNTFKVEICFTTMVHPTWWVGHHYQDIPWFTTMKMLSYAANPSATSTRPPRMRIQAAGSSIRFLSLLLPLSIQRLRWATKRNIREEGLSVKSPIEKKLPTQMGMRQVAWERIPRGKEGGRMPVRYELKAHQIYWFILQVKVRKWPRQKMLLL